MLRVKTVLKASKVHGLGLFAAEDIPAGKVIAEVDSRFDRVFDEARLHVLSDFEAVQDFIKHHGYLLDRRWWLPMDNLRFMNHSSDPNVDCKSHYTRDIAARDIKKGEELTCDYLSFDDDAQRKLGDIMENKKGKPSDG